MIRSSANNEVVQVSFERISRLSAIYLAQAAQALRIPDWAVWWILHKDLNF